MKMPNLIKVLTITNLFPNNAEPTRGIYNLQQIKELSKLAEVRVISPIVMHRNIKVPEEDIIDKIKVYYPKYFITPKILRLLYGWFLYFSIKNKVTEIRKIYEFDVIYSPWVYPDGFASFLIAKKMGVPVIIGVLGSDINIYTRYYLRKLLIKYVLDRCNKVIAVSNALEQRLVEIGVAVEKIVVIPNGVDAELFKPLDQTECRKKIGLPLNKKIILYAGNFAQVKGVDILVDAFGELARFRNDILLVLVGDGPLDKMLREKVKMLGIECNVIFAGYTTHDSVPFYMNACDVFCLPSRYEGCPNVVLEALACGRPVVASRVGGVEEIVYSDDTGRLVAPGNAIILTEALIMALERKWDYHIIREKSFGYSWVDNAARLKKELDSAVDQRSY